jgi:hypothetical protein
MNKGLPMIRTTLILMLPLLGLVACQDANKSKSGSSSNNTLNSNYCLQNPAACVGGTTGGSNGLNSNPSQQTYKPMPLVLPEPPSDNDWENPYSLYYFNKEDFPNGIPTGTCSPPTGTRPDLYDLRQGTITIAGGTKYEPDLYVPGSSLSDFTHNNSFFLVSTNDAKAFLETDTKLRVRFRIRPQEKAKAGTAGCFNRTIGGSTVGYGYTKLRFIVGLKGVNPDGTLTPGLITNPETVSGLIGGCTQTVDFSSDHKRYPNGVVLVIQDVRSNQGCTYPQGCTTMKTVDSKSCWSMDIEASVDGTKDI